MSSEPNIESTPRTARLYAAAALTAVIAGGMWLVAHFTNADLARDMQTWQEKLNLIAESRESEVSRWVEGNFKELRSLADNPSLKMYMTELQMAKPAADSAQKAYLRNLILFTAERAGFGGGNASASIPANVQPESKSGLAVTDAEHHVIVSTLMEPGIHDLMLKQTTEAKAGQERFIDIGKDKDGDPYLGFLVPVFSIQGDRTGASQIGQITGIKTIDGNLFPLLKHPGTTERTLEVLLVRKSGENIEYLSPLLDGTGALAKQIPFASEKLAEAQLMQTAGNFVSNKVDYRGKQVLATSRAIPGTPWTLIVKIDRQEALAASEQYRAGMVALFVLIIAVIALIIMASWWYAHSRRSMMLSRHFRKLAAQTAAQERLLKLVADHQPEALYIVDAGLTCRFANQKAARLAGMSESHMGGKTLADMRGAALADRIGEDCKDALSRGEMVYDIHSLRRNDEERVIRSVYVPLGHIPLPGLPKPTPGVLIVEQDISEAVNERERRLAAQRRLVDVLIRLVDRRDPFAADHSQLVAKLAEEIAIALQLDPIQVETVRIAGSLMNIGKIMIPEELLTKTTPLTSDEKRLVHESLNAPHELLRGIRFDGPVVEALSQWQEKWNGSGPLGLKGEAILLPARIIASANAFIGMVSPRSWRQAIPVESAVKMMLEQCDTQFDRRVVIAMINYIENQSGRAWLSAVLDQRQQAA